MGAGAPIFYFPSQYGGGMSVEAHRKAVQWR